MKIGIVGAGHIGTTLARRLAEVGHEVCIANSRGPDTLRDVSEKTGATAVTARQAAKAGGLVVVTVPMGKVPTLPDDLFDGVSRDVVVIDTCNYYPRQRDGRIAAIESGMPESRWVERQIGRSVIKAFNNMYAQHLGEKGRPAGSPGRAALPVAGDDAAGKDLVMALIGQLGFDAVDAGGLNESWRQQPGTPVYTKDYDAAGVRRALGEANQQRKPEWTATDRSPGTYDAPA